MHAFRQSGRFLFVDGLTRLFPNSSTQQIDFTKSSTLNNPFLSVSVLNSLREQIRNMFIETSDPTCVILEDTSILSEIGVDLKEIIEFIEECKEYAYKVICQLTERTMEF